MVSGASAEDYRSTLARDGMPAASSRHVTNCTPRPWNNVGRLSSREGVAKGSHRPHLRPEVRCHLPVLSCPRITPPRAVSLYLSPGFHGASNKMTCHPGGIGNEYISFPFFLCALPSSRFQHRGRLKASGVGIGRHSCLFGSGILHRVCVHLPQL